MKVELNKRNIDDDGAWKMTRNSAHHEDGLARVMRFPRIARRRPPDRGRRWDHCGMTTPADPACSSSSSSSPSYAAIAVVFVAAHGVVCRSPAVRLSHQMMGLLHSGLYPLSSSSLHKHPFAQGSSLSISIPSLTREGGEHAPDDCP